MKNYYPFNLTLLFALLIVGCKKEAQDRPPITGKVMLINSTTPVDRALVRFVRYLPSSWIGPNLITVTQEVITNERGEFIIPDTTTADYVQAWGIESIYGEDPSQKVYLDNYLANGGVPKVYLKPPAWITVQAVDIPPLNPEVHSIYLDTVGSGDIFWTGSVINNSATWQIFGNDTYTLRGKKTIINAGTEHFNIEVPFVNAFDTLEYTLEY